MQTPNHRRPRLILILRVLFLLLLPPTSATTQTRPTDWRPFQFLVGEWIGEGRGSPGEGEGGFTFSYDLQNTILVRKNHANYPATKERPAFSHNDLMVMYQEEGRTRAVYFDNEKHVINYGVTFSADSNSIVFISDAVASSPRFRMTYTKSGTGSVKIAFEIAPPGKPDSFVPYIEAAAHRKK